MSNSHINRLKDRMKHKQAKIATLSACIARKAAITYLPGQIKSLFSTCYVLELCLYFPHRP